jgi:Carboxypeptidase regulatory-like domain
MIRNMRRMLLCLALCILPALAGPPKTTLTIEVTNQDGKPVDRASVIVKFVRGHSVAKLGKADKTSWEMKTSQEGRVTIPPIPQGTILIQVIARNYQTFGGNFDVDEERKTISIKLNPPQSQYSAHGKNDPTEKKK